MAFAQFDSQASSDLVYVYSDQGQVIYRQPGLVKDYGNAFGGPWTPILARQENPARESQRYWIMYIDSQGRIDRIAPAFFAGEDDVKIQAGEVILNGRIVQIDTNTSEPSWKREFSPLWDPEAMVWSHTVEGEYKGVKTQVTIYIHDYLFNRETLPLKGFVENEAVGGKWEHEAKNKTANKYYNSKTTKKTTHTII